MKETSSNKEIEIAKLKRVCWFEVHGKHTTVNLTPGVTYEVAFVVKIEDHAYGWDVPVMLRLVTSTSDVQQYREKLSDMPRGKWTELIAGVFTVTPRDVRDLEFSLFELGSAWKSGLVLQGVVIRPKM
ncbi:phloem protein 2-A1 [Zostera marina]|uniref:Phloem protein 2-A1 n=1 Tax=Zostera marina TaxID=29655 RepID=A0A0K9PS13_ZOSMR|nr:phloem protein 2-A1 [Zostera marina]